MKVLLAVANGWYVLEKVPKKTIDFIKRHLPVNTKMFVGNRWHVTNSQIVNVINLTLSNDEEVDYRVLPQFLKDQVKHKVDDNPWSILHVAENAPEFIVDAVWKTLAKRYHPDTSTGNADLFMKYKAAYDTIKAKF